MNSVMHNFDLISIKGAAILDFKFRIDRIFSDSTLSMSSERPVKSNRKQFHVDVVVVVVAVVFLRSLLSAGHMTSQLSTVAF